MNSPNETDYSPTEPDDDDSLSEMDQSDSFQPPSPKERRNWLELPRDITESILWRIGTVDILNNAQRVCASWRGICWEPSMWRRIDMHNLGDLHDMDYDLEIMCRHAVDRSCGGLVDINIEYFGTDDLLQYIAERADNLKRLRIVQCYSISEEGFSEAITKFPLLEELEISYCNFEKHVVESAGRSCPLLKSFKLNNQGCKGPYMEFNEEALAIAETMPGLRHLQIFGNRLTNEGLCAILDGCPQLESLDLRQCFNVNLDGPLGKRCAERLKDFWRIHDSTHDYPFDATVAHIGGGSSEEDYPDGFSDIDILSDDYDDYYEFSDGSDFSDFDIY